MTDNEILDKFSQWTASLPDDAKALREAFESKAVPEEAKKLVVGGLAYLMRKIDIVPDYLGGLGSVDDALVMRVAAMKAIESGLGDLEEETVARLKAMSDDVGAIKDYLADLFDGFASYVTDLPSQAVRGRDAAKVLEDPETRQQFLYELADEIKNYVAKPIEQGEKALREFRSFVKAKLSK